MCVVNLLFLAQKMTPQEKKEQVTRIPIHAPDKRQATLTQAQATIGATKQ